MYNTDSGSLGQKGFQQLYQQPRASRATHSQRSFPPLMFFDAMVAKLDGQDNQVKQSNESFDGIPVTGYKQKAEPLNR